MARLAEPIKTALISLLQANMPAEIAAITAEYQDNVPLVAPAPANYYFGLRAVPPDVCPAITVEVSDIAPLVDQQGNRWAVNAHTVLIDVWVRSDTEDTIHHQLDRYARAVYEICFQNQTLVLASVSQAISLLPRRGRATEPFPRSGAFFKIWRWEFVANREEDF